jgi:hypothetical protein
VTLEVQRNHVRVRFDQCGPLGGRPRVPADQSIRNRAGIGAATPRNDAIATAASSDAAGMGT